MKRPLIASLMVFLLMGWAGRGLAADKSDIYKEIELLKERIQELEQRLEEQEAAGKKQAAKTEKTIGEKIEETLEERFGTLSLHGGMVLYYQGSHVNELEGENADSPSGAGFAGDLELSWKPAAPAFENGEFYVRVHAANGSGADRDGRDNNPVNVLLGNLNTIADDDSGEGLETGIKMLEAYYTQEFWEGRFGVLAGKTEQLHFLDENAFANDQDWQFVGKPFVNNTVLDSENEYTPVVGAAFKPAEMFSLSLVGASTSRPALEDTPLADKQKSKYDNVFSTPFLGAQATVSPKIGELQGNYRLYGWYAGYDHSKLNSDRDPIAGKDSKGWGLGISADQQVTETVGLFGRFGYNNEDVYVVEWEASGGLNLKGLVPGRDDDEIGLGFAALIPDGRFEQDDPEYHFEGYYRFGVTENLAITPDIQYVWNPGGDSKNDPIFAPTIRGVFTF